MTTYTRYLHIPIADFNVRPWHAIVEDALNQIDAAIYHALLVQNATIWDNDTEYEIGMFAVDTEDGNYYICLIGHTSGSSGNFADARAAFPTYWGAVISRPESQGEWVTATQYLINNFVVHNDVFYVCNVTHTSGVFATDLATGKWTELADLSGYVTDQSVFESQIFS